MGGIRAEVKFNALSGCEVATASDVTGAACTSISRATTGEHSDNTVTEEFVLNSDSSLESSDADGIPDDLQEIFTYGSRRAYRFTRSRDRNCPCDRIEQYDCPILDVYSRDGSLVVAFHASDMEQLREILTDLNDRNAGMSVHRLIRSEENRGDQDLVLVDRSELTERQKTVLEIAHEMGYFDHPKGANASEVADELDINASTFTEHLSAAQRKLLSTILEE